MNPNSISWAVFLSTTKIIIEWKSRIKWTLIIDYATTFEALTILNMYFSLLNNFLGKKEGMIWSSSKGTCEWNNNVQGNVFISHIKNTPIRLVAAWEGNTGPL